MKKIVEIHRLTPLGLPSDEDRAANREGIRTGIQTQLGTSRTLLGIPENSMKSDKKEEETKKPEPARLTPKEWE